MFEQIVKYIKSIYKEDFVPLHIPRFNGNEKKYLMECIDTAFVSSVGKFVDDFEIETAKFTGAKYAVACVNGTEALHIALLISGVNPNDEVLTQPLTFIATANAISYCNAAPTFIDVDKETLGMSPDKLNEFLGSNTELKNDGFCYNLKSDKRIFACVPMHTFGHPCKIEEIINICNKYNIIVVEDSAESIGSYFNGKHTGLFGELGVLSYNGNKILTTGGGGMIITNNEVYAKRAKHITTTAKIPHPYEYVHDETGYNYRMPNLNAALGLAQLEQLNEFLIKKRHLAELYSEFFKNSEIKFVTEPENSISNYWLNAIILKNKLERDTFLEYTNKNGVMTRPAWRLMNKLDMYKNSICGDLSNAEWLEERLVNIPSSVI